MDKIQLPEYQAPDMVTYTDEEILEELGPAQMVSAPPNLSLPGLTF